MTRIAIRHRRDIALLLLILVAAVLLGRYILQEQRFRFPWDPRPFEVRAEFSTGQALTPGQGQTVRVSGVRVGTLAAVELKDGKAVATMEIEPKYRPLLRVGATALLRPRTSLKDMFIELAPGSKRARPMPEGFTIPIANTLPDVSPDEFHSMLDADTRDYVRLLIGGLGEGLRNRGSELRDVLRRFEPTHRDLARVSAAVAGRRQDLRELVHALNALNDELADHQDDLAETVRTASAAFTAMGSQNTNIARAVAELPRALRATTAALGEVHGLGRVLGPASERLRPLLDQLAETSRRLTPFARAATPVVRESIRPFVRAARPVARDLFAPAETLAATTPDLTRSFDDLNTFFNLAAHNPRGREGPDDPHRQEGFLFYAGWLSHIAPSLFSHADAQGPLRYVAFETACHELRHLLDNEALGPTGATLAPMLADPTLCP